MGLTRAQAVVGACAIPLVFVLPFYVIPGSLNRRRNDVSTVFFRVAVSCTTTLLVTAAVHASPARCGLPVAAWLGLSASAATLAVPAALVAGLYAGTIARIAAGRASVPYRDTASHLAVRNLLFAPVIEELVFRACICRVLLSGGFTPGAAIALGPVFFAVAHMHHIIEAVVFQKTALKTALKTQSFQMLYTVLFGTIAELVFVVTGSLAAAIVLHAGCNYFGVPRLRAAGPSGRKFIATSWAGFAAAGAVVLWLARQPHALAECDEDVR